MMKPTERCSLCDCPIGDDDAQASLDGGLVCSACVAAALAPDHEPEEDRDD